MSLAKKFNIKPAMEDLAEDLKGSLDPVVTEDKVEVVTEPQVTEAVEVPAVVETAVDAVVEPNTVPEVSDTPTEQQTDILAELPGTPAIVDNPGCADDNSPVIEGNGVTTEPIGVNNEHVLDVVNEAATGDAAQTVTPTTVEEVTTADIVENTPVDEEELEQVPDHTEEMEEMEYMTSEVSRGFEAIEQLNKLATSLEKQESNGVSLESYNDFALIVINNVRSNLGMESEEGDVTSEKTKSLSSKITEIIKKIWEKLSSFISVVVEKIKTYFLATDKKTQEFISFIKSELIEDKVFTINPRHYKEHEEVDAQLVFGNSFLKNYEHNSKAIEKYLEELIDTFHKVKSKQTFNKRDEVFNLLKTYQTALFNDLKSESDPDKKFKKITPDGSVGLMEGNSGIQFIHSDEASINKQRLRSINKDKDENLVLEFSELEKVIREDFFRITDKVSDLVTKQIKMEIARLDSYESVDIDSFKEILSYLSNFNRFYMHYIRSLIVGPQWYMSAVKGK